METFKQNVATDRESGETWKERQHNNTDSGIQKWNHRNGNRHGIQNQILMIENIKEFHIAQFKLEDVGR